MFQTLINYIALVTCIIPLVFASYSDWKTRTVKNHIWLIMTIEGLAIAATRWVYTAELITTIFSYAVTFLISLAFFASKIFGGADAKAMMCVSLIIPQNVSTSSLTPLFPLTAFLNTFILLGLFYLLVLGFNLLRRLRGEDLFPGLESESKLRKALALLTCTRTDLDSVQTKKHFYPAQQVIKKNSKTEMHLIPPRQALDKEQINFNLLKSKVKPLSNNRIWAYFSKPLIPIILISVIISFFLGDLLFFPLKIF
ncbi:MAG: A24 family peptidase [Candidatus Freyarchaeum deiterrae]